MAGLLRREVGDAARVDPFDRFDRLMTDWMRLLPFRQMALFGEDWPMGARDVIRVDEFHDGETLVIRAELPGVDPEKDIELTVLDGVLRIEAERREESDTEEKGFVRHELRHGSFTRALRLPAGVSEADITATYTDGILEIRVPEPEPATVTKVPVTKA